MTVPVQSVAPYAYDPAFGIREDASLKAALMGVVVTDTTSHARAVPVYFRVPDDANRAKVFPYITIDSIGSPTRDPSREHRNQMYWGGTYGYRPVNLPTEGDFAVSDYPIPMTLRYQITTWARSVQHDRQMLMQLSQDVLAPRFGCLTMVDTASGSQDSDDSYRRLDIDAGPTPSAVRDKDQKRIFRQIWTISVSSEMYLSAFTALQKVSTVVFDPPPADEPYYAI